MNARKVVIASAAALLLGAVPAGAQVAATDSVADAQTSIPLLFDYPLAPDSIANLSDRAAWVMQNFWKPMDFSASSVDQTALFHAFNVYVASMRWAPEQDVLASINSLIKNLKKNPALTLQFAMAAERDLYGPKAEVWSDEAYIPFLEAVVAQKKLPSSRRARYERQLKILKNSLVGAPATGIQFKDVRGSVGQYVPDGRWTIIEFGDPTCDVCRYSQLRFDTNAAVSKAIKNGKIGAFFIIPDPEENWELTVDQAPSQWNIGAAPDVDEVYDIRSQPSFYVIDSDNKIRLKHVGAADVLQFMEAVLKAEEANTSNSK